MNAPTYYGRELPVPTPSDLIGSNAEAAHKAVEKVLNIFNEAPAHHLAYLLASEHRTLVQNAMRDLVVPFILWLAQDFDEGRFDLRNEGACRLAAEMRDTFMAGEVSLPTV